MKIFKLKGMSNYKKITLFLKVLTLVTFVMLFCKRLFSDYDIVEFNTVYNAIIFHISIISNKKNFFILILLLYIIYVGYCTAIQLKYFKGIQIKYLNKFLCFYILLLALYLILIANYQHMFLTFLIHIPLGIFLSSWDRKAFIFIIIKYITFIFIMQYISYQDSYKNISIYLLILIGAYFGFWFSEKYLTASLKIEIDYTNTVDFYGGLKLQKEFIKLKLIRLSRFLKRSFHNSTPILISIICSFLFLLVIIPVGLKYGKYTSVVDGIWDMKSFYLTSIIITGITSITGAEKKNHEILLKQWYIYTDFLSIANSCSSFLYSDVLSIKNLDDYYELYNVPYESNKQYNKINKFINKLEQQENNQYNSNIDYYIFKDTISDYITKLSEFKPLCNENNIVGFSKHDYTYLKDTIYLLNEISRIDIKNDQYMLIMAEYYREIFWRLEYAVSSLRRPWTYDLSNNKRINKIITNHLCTLYE